MGRWICRWIQKKVYLIVFYFILRSTKEITMHDVFQVQVIAIICSVCARQLNEVSWEIEVNLTLISLYWQLIPSTPSPPSAELTHLCGISLCWWYVHVDHIRGLVHCKLAEKQTLIALVNRRYWRAKYFMVWHRPYGYSSNTLGPHLLICF